LEPAQPESAQNFSCPAFNLSTTKNISLTIPLTQIPAQETTYICHAFQVPNDTKYQIIGLTPFLNNSRFIHHMILFGCQSSSFNESEVNSTWQCSMSPVGCTSFIGLWSIGSPGECLSDQYGFPIGLGGFQYVVLQIHWNNPLKIADQYDASGIHLYYTSQLRPNDGQILMVGQNDLIIPPHEASFHASGKCTKNCSSLINPRTVYIPAAVMHMHYQGISGNIQLLRDGQPPFTFVNDPNYEFNLPIAFRFDQPMVFNAGDEILVNCVYQTLNKNTTTYWGESTSDEMCYGFITIYPAVPNFDQCTQFDNIDMCSLAPNLTQIDCDVTGLIQLLQNPLIYKCDTSCSGPCMQMFYSLYNTGCINDNTTVGQFIKQDFGYGTPGFDQFYELVEFCVSQEPAGNFSLSGNMTSPISGNGTTPIPGNMTTPTLIPAGNFSMSGNMTTPTLVPAGNFSMSGNMTLPISGNMTTPISENMTTPELEPTGNFSISGNMTFSNSTNRGAASVKCDVYLSFSLLIIATLTSLVMKCTAI